MRSRPHSSRTLSLAVALALGTATGPASRLRAATAPLTPPARGALPVPCAPGACGSQGPSGFVTAGKANATATGNTLTVNQQTTSATLNWSSFNVGAGASVIFKQPGASSVALNRIYQADPSQIFGVVKANGQIFLINQNGFLFGNGSVVNVGGLVASSLNVSDATFSQGILNPGLLSGELAQAAFVQGLNNDGTQGAVNTAATITVAPGATLTTNAANGRLLLAAPTVDNFGTLSAADGQVVLAAGQKLYLQASQNSDLRGLVVEVDGGGTATNEAGATLSAARGNVTMLGLAVNQLGRVSATTSVAANGSIRLVAGDTVAPLSITNRALEASHGGTLTLGPQSLTTVTPDTSGGTAVDGSLQQQSVLEFDGAQVYLQGGSQVVAPDARLAITARLNPSIATPSSTAPEQASIRLDSGALIDLSGSNDAVPVATNIVEAQLRATEFADSPEQRNGPLRGQTVYVDVRQGTAAQPGTTLANLSGEAGLVQRDIYQRTSSGGTVTLDSSGDVVMQAGSKVNVSGGAVTYTPGWIQTSYLVTADGKLVPISQANEATRYVGVVNPTVSRSDDRWGSISVAPNSALASYDPGYVQGSAAGTLSIAAPTMVLQGALQGSAVTGQLQRAAGTTVPGGQLVIGVAPVAGAAPDFRAPAIEIVTTPTPVEVADGATLPSPIPVQLPVAALNQDGFSRITLYSNGSITQAAATPIALPVGGSISFTAPTINLNSSITAPGGSITATSEPGALSTAATLATAGIYVGPDVALDVRGNWTNDGVLAQGAVPTSAVALDGGSITLNQAVYGGTLSIGADSALSVSGGAWAKQGGALTPGSAGSITLNEGAGGTLTLGAGIGLDGYATQGATHGSSAGGGTLSITAPRIEIAAGGKNWAAAQTVSSDRATGGSLVLDASLFSGYGFSAFNLTADGPALSNVTSVPTLATPANFTVMPGVHVNLDPQTYVFTPAARSAASAANLGSVLAPALAPSNQHLSESLTLTSSVNGSLQNTSSADVGGVAIGAGSVISADPGSKIVVASAGGIAADGAMHAPGGSITLSTLQPASEQLDPGYLPDLRIDLGAASVLDVSGTPIYQSTTTGLLSGSLLPGGSVTLSAVRGSVVAEAGSLINIAGARAPFDVQAPGATTAPERSNLGSAAGSLTVSAPETISLLGALEAQGGRGDTLQAPGGTLSVTLSRVVGTGFSSGSGTTPETFAPTDSTRVIELLPNAPLVASTPASGQAVLDPNRIAASGVDNLFLSADQVELGSGTTLSLGRSITLQTPSLVVAPGARASLAAPYLALGSGTTSYTEQTATPGNGAVTLTGTESVSLTGALSFDGVGSAVISSGGFIQLIGNGQVAGSTGSLSIAGTLNLIGSELFPSTETSYSILARGGINDTVTIQQAGTRPATPLSVAGAVSITADDINQNGSIVAPFGTISLNAVAPINGTATDGVLSLGAGSYTSVSGAGSLIPFGQVNNGTAWVYGLNAAQVNSITPINITGTPSRQVSLNGSAVRMASGSTVDVSGGGDLYASEFTPGTGGTKDALAGSATTGLYAILPSLRGQFAAYDPLTFSDSGLTPGQSVYLAGGGGLAAGYYPLLPARYALLPGAFLVQAVSGYANLTPGSTGTLANGAPVVAGYLTFGTTGLGGATYTGFELQPGSYAKQLATYTDNYASTFFAATATQAGLTAPPTLPADAGVLSITATAALSANGSVLGKAAAGGSNALVELSAPAIEIDAANDAPVVPGVVQISAPTLQSWSPGRVLLGGTYTGADTVDVTATSVSVVAGSAFSANEIVIVANDAITVGNNASLQSTSAVTGKAASVAAIPTTLSLTGNDAGSAALLSVSDLSAYVPTRNGATNVGEGTLQVASGAKVASSGAISIDVPGGATLAPGVLSGPGANFALGAGHVVFGAAGSAPGALVLDSTVLSAVSAGHALELSSTGSIDFDEAVTIGNPSGNNKLASVTLSAATLTNLLPGTDSTISAQTISLGGPTTVAAPVQAGSGVLTFNAGTLNLGPGLETVNGFSRTVLNAAGTIDGTGIGGVIGAGDVSVTAGLITAASGAQTQLAAAGGALTLASNGATATPRGSLAPGGQLVLSGQSVQDGATIVLPSGQVIVDAAGPLTVNGTASIDTAGLLPLATGITHGSPGGKIVLASGSDLSVAQGAVLDVSGGSGAGAGVLAIQSGGSASIAGTLRGTAAAGLAGGDFSLVAQSVQNFAALATDIGAGGFSGAQAIETRTGNLDVARGTTMASRSVTLIADSGAISVEGTIDASGTGQRGAIVLDAATNLSLANTAVLRADGTDAATRGGRIELSTTTGTIAIDPAATVSAHGAGSYGQLIVRAPSTSSDLAVSGLPAGLSQVDQVFIEPVQSFALSSGTPAASEFNADEATVASWVAANGQALLSRLGVASTRNVALSPFIDFTYNGDLTLPALDLLGAGWRFNGVPGTLAVHATGNLNVTGNLSDGFQSVTLTSGTGSHKTKVTQTDLTPGPSSSILLVAGADPGSASASGVVAGAAADLSISDGVVVRTGTGDITLAAARDVLVGTPGGAGASVYTAGTPAAATFNPAGATSATKNLSLYTTYPDQGGSVTVSAGRDIVAAPVIEAPGTWQPRTAGLTADGSVAPEWGVDPGKFGWSFGALGGGDVSLVAGRSAVDVSAAVADSAKIVNGSLTYFGGGNLSVQTGQDVLSSEFYVGHGTGTIRAFGALGSDPAYASPVGTLLYAGDASFSVNALGSVLLEGELQSTSLSATLPTGSLLVPNALDPTQAPVKTPIQNLSYFYRYSPSAALDVASAGGSVTLKSGDGALLSFLDQTTFSSVVSVLAPSLDVAAYGGNLTLIGNPYLYPSDRGQLSLYTVRDLDLTNATLIMLDTASSVVHGVSNVGNVTSVTSDLIGEGTASAASSARHTGDLTPAVIAAGRDILGNPFGAAFQLPKAAQITAGRDIVDVGIQLQNVNASDVSLVQAGGSITYSPASSQLSDVIGGGGRVDFVAGGAIDLGFSRGITTTGNLLNGNLTTTTGADLNVLVGIGQPLDSAKFVSAIISPSATYQGELIAYVEQQTGASGLTYAQAESQFGAFSTLEQRPLLLNIFFDALVQSGRAAVKTPSVGYAAGFDAINALFPGSNPKGTASSPYAGSLGMGFSQIYTLDGGNISIVAPGGGVNVGLANPPANLAALGLARLPSQLGIVAEGTGNVDIFTYGDVNVNASRVFTLGGGTIAMWSSTGNVDAGRGAKTSVSAPPPIVTVDASGQVTVNFGSTVSGSGIGTIQTEPDQAAGNVDIYAPSGFIDAGDAGIRAAGNASFGAVGFLNASNVQVGGTSVGVPPAVSGLGAALAGASGAGSASSAASTSGASSGNGAKDTTQQSLGATALGWLDVFVTGLGEESCKPDDLDCLKRQKH